MDASERRQHHHARNSQINEFKQNDRQPGGSRFNPILDNLGDAVEIENGVALSVLRALCRQPITNSTKASKLLCLNSREQCMFSAAKESRSRPMQLKHNTSTLDKPQHSSVVISENSDPNLQITNMNPGATSTCINSLTLGKPLDPRASLPAGSGDDNSRIEQQRCIITLKLPSGEWCSDAATLRFEAINFFKILFTADDMPSGQLRVSGWFPPLSQKYKVNDVYPASIARSNCSPLWRTLSNGWSKFLPSIAWSIGNGNSINPFKDVWVPSLGPLCHHMLDPTNVSRGLTLNDLVIAEGNWNIQVLSILFSGSTIAHILNIKCPNPVDETFFQSLPFRLQQSTRNGYGCAVGLPLFSPPLAASPSCGPCSSFLFVELATMRNDLIFNNLAKYYSDSVTPDRVPPSISCLETLQWSVPGLGWVCLNVDGVISLPLSDGRIGGLILNNDGDWIVGFAKAISHSDSLQAELLALFEGMDLA
ncbi:hypothetical protein V6N11_009421 [Hibiscus sabdariffa]|uniref:RNase H type-1 domain-containing protein n=1 Tax=Hibiscus sabdariffa TaxID=183260 RepID=A0ABR2NSR8_9ROSI